MSIFDDIIDTGSDIVLDGVDAVLSIGDGGNNNGRDRKRSVTEAFEPRRVIYGEAVVKGTPVFIGTTGLHNQHLHLMYVIAAQESEEIYEVYFNDELAGRSTGRYVTDPVNHPGYDGRARNEFDHGSRKFASGILNLRGHLSGGVQPMQLDDNWTSGGNHELFGHTCSLVTLKYRESLYPGGIPNITFRVRGKRLYDPRTDTSYYSRNSALAVLDWLKEYMEIPDSEIDTASFIAGANISDEDVLIEGGGTEKRYTVGGYLELDKTPLENLEKLLASANAWLSFVQGKWRLSMPVYSAPIVDLTSSDLAGGVSFQPSQGKQGRLNTVRSSYISPDHNWERVDAPILRVPSYITQDKERLEGAFDYELVTSGFQVQRLNKIKMEQSRYGLVVSARFKWKALQATVGDHVTLTMQEFGWSARVFRVYQCEIDWSAGVRMTLKEDASAIYDWAIGDVLAISAPPALSLPDPQPVIPTDLTIEEELYSTNNGVSVKTRVVISWTEQDLGPQEYELQIKKSADSEWSVIDGNYAGSEFRYDDFEPGIYDFRVRAVNDIGRVSEWLLLEDVDVLGKSAPPPDVSTLTFNSGVLEWVYENEPLDLAGFEVRYADSISATWEDASPLHAGLVGHSKYYLGFTPDSEAMFFVKARDDSRNYSVNAATATVSATPGGTSQLVDIVSDTITRSGIFTTKFHGALTINNYVTFLGDDSNDDKSPPQGTLSATSIFGATLAQCYAIGDGGTQLYLGFTNMLDPNLIEGVDYRWNTSDPWQSITQNANGQQDVLGDRWRLTYDVGSLFGSQLSPGGNGGIYLRLSQSDPDSVSVTLAEWTSGGNDRVGATSASHSDGANGTLSNTSVGGAILAGIYTNQAGSLSIAFEGDTTSNHPFEKLFITGTSAADSGNRTVKRSQMAGIPLYFSGDDLTIYIFTQNDLGFDPEFTGTTGDIETVNFYSY